MTLGKGRAAAITDADIAALAAEIGCHPADLEAIAQVESDGFGWFKDGRIKILFEKHWFYKLLPAGKRENARKAGLARKNWISPSKGGYKDQIGADARYQLLAKAMKIDPDAALQSISMGRFQIMGFNYKICGFKSAEGMWVSFLDDEYNQLRAFANFLKSKGLYKALADRDFQAIETKYNGGGLNGAYARRMRREADKLRAGKWKSGLSKAAQDAVERPKPTHAPSKPKQDNTPPAPKKRGKGGIVGLLIIVALAAIGWFSGIVQQLTGIGQ